MPKLIPATLLIGFLVLAACDNVRQEVNDCYFGDYKLSSVRDSNGDEYNLIRHETGNLTTCGVSSRAAPFERQSSGGVIRYFEIHPDDIEDTVSSLTGTRPELPEQIEVGLGAVGQFDDTGPVWPLYQTEWR